MRIIAGKAGRIAIKVPSAVARPTTDFVRQAVFSILGERVENARVLDLFAGSGALGLEALSRGAKSCIFVDEHRQAVSVIQRKSNQSPARRRPRREIRGRHLPQARRRHLRSHLRRSTVLEILRRQGPRRRSPEKRPDPATPRTRRLVHRGDFLPPEIARMPRISPSPTAANTAAARFYSTPKSSPGLQSNAFKDCRSSLSRKGLQKVARGRGAIATTTPGSGFQRIRTLKGVPEMSDVSRQSTISATRCRGRILLFSRFPGCSSRMLLDPGLQDAIPTGIKMRTAITESLKALD